MLESHNSNCRCGLGVCLACGESGFDPRSGQTEVVKTVNDSSTAKRSASGVSVMVLAYDRYEGLARVTVGVAR